METIPNVIDISEEKLQYLYIDSIFYKSTKTLQIDLKSFQPLVCTIVSIIKCFSNSNWHSGLKSSHWVILDQLSYCRSEVKRHCCTFVIIRMNWIYVLLFVNIHSLPTLVVQATVAKAALGLPDRDVAATLCQKQPHLTPPVTTHHSLGEVGELSCLRTA